MAEVWRWLIMAVWLLAAVALIWVVLTFEPSSLVRFP
jgi:hypothetical protein